MTKIKKFLDRFTAKTIEKFDSYAKVTTKDCEVICEMKALGRGQKKTVAALNVLLANIEDGESKVLVIGLNKLFPKVKWFECESSKLTDFDEIINDIHNMILTKLEKKLESRNKRELKKFLNGFYIEDAKGQAFSELPAKFYHKAPGLSRTQMVPLTVSYLQFEYELNNKRAPSSAMERGSALHSLLLTPSLFKKEVDVKPLNLRGDKKRIYEIYSDGKTRIGESDKEDILMAKSNFEANPIAKALLDRADKEVSFFWEEKRGDQVVGQRSRADGVIRLKNNDPIIETLKKVPSIAMLVRNLKLEDGDYIMFDLKFTRSVEEGMVTKDSFNRGYAFQGAHYSRGVEMVMGKKVKLFFVLNIQNEAPFDVSVDLFDESMLEVGMRQRELALERYFYHQKNPKAPKGVNSEVRIISPKNYMLYNVVEEEERAKEDGVSAKKSLFG